MSRRDGREVVAGKRLRMRRSSSISPPPLMSDVMTVVLLGKSVAENSQVGNFILGRAAFDSEAPPDVVERVGGRLKDRHVMLINSPQLLQTNLSDLQIIQTVRECVSLSAPGPHVIVLLLKHEQCSTEDQERVKKLQDSFSEQLFQHTMVLSTEESNETNDILQEIIQKCSRRHFSLQRSSPDDLLQAFKVIVKINNGRRLVCAQYEASQDFTMKQQDTERRSAEREDELRIVLLGKTGVGKSATGNTILGRDAFKAELSQELVTKECQRETCEINGQRVTVIDTPGLFDTELTNEEIQREISNCISMILPGPHVFVIVLNLGQRFTQEEEKSVKLIQEMFGENSLMFTVVLFTRGDDLNEDIEQCLGKPGSPLMKLIEACGNRYHVINNKQTRDRTQVTDLLEKIDHMVKENGGSYYSCKKFREMEREEQEQQMNVLIERVREKEEEIKRLEEEKERMKMTMEEERQNHDKEMKQERDTFRHVIEEMRQEKEKIKTEKEKLQIEHNTEIEEMKQEEKMRREEEDEKRKEKERRDWVEFNERLKQEREKMEKREKDLQTKYEAEEKKMETQIEKLNREREELMKKLEKEKENLKMMKEEERQNYDEERKRREEEHRKSIEWFKRNVTEQEEKERKTREMVKKEQGELEKQKQEEEMRREGNISNEQIDRLIREKEKIEREKQELEKKLKEERNMRENVEKTFKEQVKLLKEQHKDELKRKQEECRKEYERENEKKICSETNDSLQGENKEIQDLFDRLRQRKHHKLTPADVPEINEGLLQSHESCAEEELIQTFLQKLLMMNYRAKQLSVRAPSEQDQDHDPIHPMDVQMAVFHHGDGFLKQLMVTKLSQCQYALPLLVPDPFKQQIEFPLWTFRQIKKSWKMRNTNNEIISQTQPMYKAQTPMVFFFRFGSLSSSKSQLMNSLINEKHNTFFHRNGSGSSRTRLLMDGVVEIAWYCPSGSKDDHFTQCVAFCNLHGDAETHKKQLQILTEMASVNVVLLPQLDRKKVSEDIINAEFEKLYENSKPLICLFPEDVLPVKETCEGRYKIGMKGRNQSDISEELRGALNKCMSESSSTFRLEDVSKHSDIRVDEEDDDDCRKAREAAQKMVSLLENKDLTETKELFLPHQGKLWHQWSQKNRELHRPRPDETETDLRRKRTEMEEIRKRQHESDTSEFTKLFIKEMSSNDENMIKMKMFFLKWLRILLDEYTTTDLSALHPKYDEKQSTVLKAEQTELERRSEDLQAATFGLEHIMREIGQIYEACSSVNMNKKDLQFHYYSLPSLAAEMMISGFPLELMDGDAAHVPVIWISAVLDELIQTLGEQRVFVLSVLGLQSSGKSTMLNAMFGLQFDVSARRCTRGAFMQLVRVSDEMKTQMNIDYILVIDTEGLRAPELSGRSTRDHDNELATFVVGLANLTLINIFGENPSDMQDILQIVAQAFRRMKKKVRLNPSFVFVHQNISGVTAGERNEEEKRLLQEKLDEMTKHADFAHLWEGNPAMAAPNPTQLKTTIMSHGASGMIRDIKEHIKDLWETLLKECFVETT